MSLSAHDAERPILLSAVRGLVDAARAKRAVLAIDSPERAFYLGVDAAAQEVLRPELAASRAPNWLDAETLAFREGYVRTADMLASARSSAEPPFRFRVPEFEAS